MSSLKRFLMNSTVLFVIWEMTDRKSTRLNSSHSSISYAVFCLKQPPLRHGVGGKALVEDHDRRFRPRALEVGIDLRQKLRHHHALVDDVFFLKERDTAKLYPLSEPAFLPP